MPVRTYKYTGADMIDPTTTPTGYVASNGDNLLFTPMVTPSTKIVGTAQHTHFPLESRDVLWNSFKTELYRYTTTSPVDYETTLELYGLTGNNEELVGEQIFTTCTSPGTTEIVGFDLTRSACKAPFTVETGTTTPGTIRVNLPIRYSNYEEVKLNHNYYLIDQLNNSSIAPFWTASTPSGTVTETTALTVTINSGVNGFWWDTSENGPLIHTPIPSSGDWRMSVKLNSYTVNDHTEAGIILYKDRNNAFRLSRHKDTGFSKDNFRLDKIVGGTVTEELATIPITTLPIYLSIAYIGGSYYFNYSTTGSNWSYIYSTNTLGFTPVSVGMFAINWGSYLAVAAPFVDFIITNKTGDVTYNTSTSMSSTPGDDDLYVTYSTPTLWRDGTYTSLTYNEYANYSKTTNTLPLNNRSIGRLGYDGMDKYDGLKIKITTTSDNTYTTKWNWSEYKYEV